VLVYWRGGFSARSANETNRQQIFVIFMQQLFVNDGDSILRRDYNQTISVKVLVFTADVVVLSQLRKLEAQQ
jgi:hypothetical protein